MNDYIPIRSTVPPAKHKAWKRYQKEIDANPVKLCRIRNASILYPVQKYFFSLDFFVHWHRLRSILPDFTLYSFFKRNVMITTSDRCQANGKEKSKLKSNFWTGVQYTCVSYRIPDWIRTQFLWYLFHALVLGWGDSAPDWYIGISVESALRHFFWVWWGGMVVSLKGTERNENWRKSITVDSTDRHQEGIIQCYDLS